MNQWSKDVVKWQVGNILYMSIPFTWLLSKAKDIANQHKGKVVVGGTAIDLMGCDWAETPGEVPYDVLSFHNPLATFTTRGCPNKCKFCAVPKIEGEFRELRGWKPNPVICDNNILASSRQHFERVIDSLKPFPYADFNQGLDARLITPWHVDQLARLKKVKVRFAFDHVKYETQVKEAIDLVRGKGLKDIGIYVLIGYNDTPEDAQHRLELVRSWGIRPNPMRYQPLDATRKNSHVALNWAESELKKMMQYYSRLSWYDHILYENFERYPFNDNQTQEVLPL